MARLCLPKEARDNIKTALSNGDLPLKTLLELDDVSRNALFAKYVGKDYAPTLNAKFEQAILSNQKNALRNWVSKATNITEPVRRNMLKKVDRLEKVLSKNETDDFLGDLVQDKMGMKMTEEEVDRVFELKKAVDDAEAKLTPDTPAGSPEGMEYGLAVRQFDKYVDGLKADAEVTKGAWAKIKGIGGLAKSLVASIDASFPGRQGFKLFLDGKYSIWAKGVATDIKVLAKTLATKTDADIAPIDLVWAEIYSRPNFRNGKYRASKNGYGFVGREEAFPTSLPSRAPFGIGRLYKASEDAYNATAIRMRADLADAMIAMAEQNGQDVMDETVATGIGSVVSAMTGRGNLRGLEPSAQTLNNLFFSPRFLMANLDTLTAHITDPKITPYARKEALKSLFRMSASLGALLVTFKALNPDAVELDPRKGRFGKIRIGQNDIDLTGGMGGLVQMASRVLPITYIDGVRGSWKYSSQTRKWSNMLEPGYGESSLMDYMSQFFQGKLSPTAGMVRDYMNRSDFSGKKPTVTSSALNLMIPISAKTVYNGIQNGNDHMLSIAIAEFLGFSSSGTAMRGYGKKWKQLQEEQPDVFQKALIDTTELFNQEAQSLENSSEWKDMDNEQRSKELDDIRAQVSEDVLSQYGI